MDKIIETCKFYFLVFMVVFGYTTAHYFLTGVYVGAALDKLVVFEVAKPYAYRILMPGIAALFRPLAGPSISFFILEFFSVLILYHVTRRMLEHFFNERASKAYSLLLLILLSIVYVVNYRLANGGAVALFYPYDTPALVFTILGLHLSLQKEWSWLYLLMVVATLNRESSLLILLMVPALYLGSESSWQKPTLVLGLVYLATRYIVSNLLEDKAGVVMEYANQKSGYPHLTENIYFLLQKNYWLWLMNEFVFFPVIWLVLNHYIPRNLLRLRFVAYAYIIGLFIVGNITEARIWGEAVIILYLPILLGIKHWVSGTVQLRPTGMNHLQTLEHYAIPCSLLALFIGGCFFFLHTAA